MNSSDTAPSERIGQIRRIVHCGEVLRVLYLPQK